MDDGDSNEKRKISNSILNVRHVFQSIRVRCPFKMDDKCNGWLLEWNFRFLPIISILFYIILYLV